MTSQSESFSKKHAPLGRASVIAARTSKGFSLIELLVVIAIIGLLSSIVLASLSGARKRGRDGRRVADISQLKLALELFYEGNRFYPTALSLLVAPGYIPAIPTDPSTGNAYSYVALRGAATSLSTCASYHLGAKMEIDTVGTGGSIFNDDKDGTVGGSYGTALEDGPLCTGTSQTPSQSPGSDFSGADAGLVYDMRP